MTGDPQLFEGYEVQGSSFTVSGEVDGAGEAMEYQDTRWLLVKVRCHKVLHEPASKQSKDPVRTHKLVIEHARPFSDDEVVDLARQGKLAT